MTSYDEVPYKSYPYRQSHPDRLATVAALFGLQAAPLAKCRVLELGCSTGGNILPLAELFPQSEFVGIDASSRQIAEGAATAKELGLENITLKHANIEEVGAELGKFDYIVSHGVYSWIPDDVQDKLLALCARNLAERGIAYISYNTYSGWHMRGMIRDMMKFRARGFSSPADRVRHARALLDFLVQAVPDGMERGGKEEPPGRGREANPYGILLKRELNLLREKEDYYLFHEHLEEINEPLYFHQFMERAEGKGLQYLGEADFGAMSLRNFPPPVEAMLSQVSANLIETEQYMDFVRNRMFRQTLLVHAGVPLDRTLPADRLLGLYVASPARPQDLPGDPRSSEPVTFHGGGAVTTTTDPLMKGALLHLGEAWPQAVAFTDLVAITRSRLDSNPVVVDTARLTHDSRRLADPLLRCYATGQVELSVNPSQFTLDVSETPRTTRLARHQAEAGNMVTNLRHETVHLNDLQRHVLRYLDGRHDVASLRAAVAEEVGRGAILVREGGQNIKDTQRAGEILSPSIEHSLAQLARQALLV